MRKGPSPARKRTSAWLGPKWRCCCAAAKQCLTVLTPRTAAHQAPLPLSIFQSLLQFTSIKSVMASKHLILCRPLLLLPSVFPSIRVFSNESAFHMRWPKYWSFTFSISPTSEHAGLISFRMGWLDLLAVPGTLKSLFQHHSSKASILRCSAFTVQLSHPYVTTGETIALTRWTFVCKMMTIHLFAYNQFGNTPLKRTLWLYWVYLNNPGSAPHIKVLNLITSQNLLLTCEVTYSQALEIRMWTSGLVFWHDSFVLDVVHSYFCTGLCRCVTLP